MDKQFYVYVHSKPDGTIFYVGKGHGRRAYDFAPSRRSLHHINIVRKYGREHIGVAILPQSDEGAAFAFERELIAMLKTHGVKLINITDGGEGAAGRPMNEAQKRGFERGRGPDAARGITPESRAKINAALKANKHKVVAWKASPEGQAHIKSLGNKSAEALKKRAPYSQVCPGCGGTFETKSFRAIFCSILCRQRFRRKQLK